MKRPSTYNDHNDSLKRFEEIFNRVGKKKNIKIIPNATENYSDDGKIVLNGQKKMIIFDWEKRDVNIVNENGGFKFDSLGQFDRKFNKTPSIGISIQCNKNEMYFVAALHSKFGKSISVLQKTDSEEKENGKMRTTSEFEIFSFDDEGVGRFIACLLLWKDETDFLRIDEND